ncbi:MAG: hypothetical protein Q8900_08980 [Bacillota bacterium]|nr:hypothetical protein [Bacillota bacterium]
MLEDYKEIMDKVLVSSKLEDNTIKKLRSKSNKHSNQNKLVSSKNEYMKKDSGFLRKFGIFAACIAILILTTALFNKVQTLRNPEHSKKAEIAVHNPTIKDGTALHKKQTIIYSPNTVQYRLQTENPLSISNSASASVDLKAPAHTNIQSLFTYSDSVVKGYVYSTDYFWVHTDFFKTLYTKSVIIVEKSYKSGIKQDDKITVFESGGVTTLKDYIDNTSDNEKKDFETKPSDFDPYFGKSPDTLIDIDYKSLSGISAMRTNQEVVLFLKQDNFQNFGVYSGLGYWVESNEGGKMLLDKSIYKQIIPEVYSTLINDNSIGENNIDKLMKYASGDGDKP